MKLDSRSARQMTTEGDSSSPVLGNSYYLVLFGSWVDCPGSTLSCYSGILGTKQVVLVAGEKKGAVVLLTFPVLDDFLEATLSAPQRALCDFRPVHDSEEFVLSFFF